VWGLAFKPNTDDMREAPSRRLIAALRGATVRAYDPVAIDEARRVLALDLERRRRARVCTSSIRRMRRSPAPMRS
jgi:UDPglucose 6-dehydrogenase